MTVTADYTPLDLDLRLRHDNHTPIVVTFDETNFTGYTLPKLLIARAHGAAVTTIAGTVTDALDGELTFEIDSTAWDDLGDLRKAVYQIEILDGDENRIMLMAGDAEIEASL